MLRGPSTGGRVLAASAGMAAFVCLVWVWSPPPGPDDPADRYHVRRTFSAHAALVVEIEISGRYNPEAIARQVVESLERPYAEVLVYFYAPRTALAERRIQWTWRTGYTEMVLAGANRESP